MNELLTNLSDLTALTALEIVLGIDNIVFIAIVTARLPRDQQSSARRVGLFMAMLTRILLLLSLNWIKEHGSEPFFEFSSLGIAKEWFLDSDRVELNEVSWRDVILFVGGLFLIGKSVLEIHEKMEHVPHTQSGARATSFFSAIAQIAVLDIVFSLDSVITAVGIADRVWVMVAAIVISIAIMMTFANRVSNFVENNPTIKMLALSFLILIGVMLVGEGAGAHLDKGYVYFAMVFSLIVEFLNIRLRKKQDRAGRLEPMEVLED